MYMMTSYDFTGDVTDDITLSPSKCANNQNLVVIYTFLPKYRFHVITTLCGSAIFVVENSSVKSVIIVLLKIWHHMVH